MEVGTGVEPGSRWGHGQGQGVQRHCTVIPCAATRRRLEVDANSFTIALLLLRDVEIGIGHPLVIVGDDLHPNVFHN